MTAAPRPDAATDREAHDPHCLSADEEDVLLRGAPWARFAVLGDSVAEGVGDPVPGYADLGWGDRIAAALARQHPGRARYRNFGRRDLRAAEVRATQLGPALDFAPDLVLLACGGNDALRRSFDADGVRAELMAMTTALQEGGAEVMTVTMFDITRAGVVPEELREPLRRRLGALAEVVRAVARDRDTLHVDFAEHPAVADPGIYSADGRHGNRRGHAVAAAGAVRRLGRRLGNRLPAEAAEAAEAAGDAGDTRGAGDAGPDRPDRGDEP